MAKVTRLTLDNSGELDRRRLNFREISGDADAPLESVGQDLRKARERKGEDLDYIARVLKIRQDYLVAIEESSIEALPGRTYAIGFVRAYATYLGLDGNEYVERLKSEVAGRDEKDPPPVVSAPAERNWAQGVWIAGALLFLALIYAVYLAVSSTRLTEQPVMPVPERLAAQAGLPPTLPPQSVDNVRGNTAPAAAPSVQASSALPPASPVNAVAPLVPQPVSAPAVPEGRKYGVQNINGRITLRMHRPAHVVVRGGDNRLFLNRMLQPGDTYVVPNIAGLTMSAPDGGAVELLLDGGSVGFAGQNGANAENLPLNPQALSERQTRG